MTTSDANAAIACDVASSTLVFLFGDLFVVPCKPGERGTRAFAGERVVPTVGLAKMMYAATFAQLHQANLIKLEQYTKKTLRVFTTHGVSVTISGDLTPVSDDRVIHLLKQSRRARQGKATVQELVYSALPVSEKPFGRVVQMAIDEAVEKGYLTLTSTGHPGGHLEPNLERIKTLRPAAEALQADWQALYREDKELADAVREQVEKGIGSRQRDDDDGFDFDYDD